MGSAAGFTADVTRCIAGVVPCVGSAAGFTADVTRCIAGVVPCVGNATSGTAGIARCIARTGVTVEGRVCHARRHLIGSYRKHCAGVTCIMRVRFRYALEEQIICFRIKPGELIALLPVNTVPRVFIAAYCIQCYAIIGLTRQCGSSRLALHSLIGFCDKAFAALSCVCGGSFLVSLIESVFSCAGKTAKHIARLPGSAVFRILATINCNQCYCAGGEAFDHRRIGN